jgi:pantetheine-phosphate adenylyltransferase
VPGTGRIVLGGTFDHLHAGHEALLATAFRAGRSVAIGLTTGRYLRGHPKPDERRIQPYAVRRRRLARWLAARYPRARWTIVPISDAFGGSVEEGVAGLVVSADTIGGGRAVNAERARRGRRPVPILVVPLVLADDLRPVSSRRIRSGEIDRDGRRTAPISVEIATNAPADRAALVAGVRRAFPRARVRRPGSTGAGRARRTAASAEFVLRARRVRAGEVLVTLATPQVALRAVRVAARSPGALAGGVASLIRGSRHANRLSAPPR